MKSYLCPHLSCYSHDVSAAEPSSLLQAADLVGIIRKFYTKSVIQSAVLISLSTSNGISYQLILFNDIYLS